MDYVLILNAKLSVVRNAELKRRSTNVCAYNNSHWPNSSPSYDNLICHESVNRLDSSPPSSSFGINHERQPTGTTVVRSNPSSDFHMAQGSKTSNPPTTLPLKKSIAKSVPRPGAEDFSSGLMKKKCGYPRKYGHKSAGWLLHLIPWTLNLKTSGLPARSHSGFETWSP
ncbi:hypothetical protein YC2023_045083 [Brassica napus]